MRSTAIALTLALTLTQAGFVRAQGPALSSEESQVLEQTNAQRRAAGLSELRVNSQLMDAARRHSSNMAAHNKLDHGLGGSVGDRARAAGYSFSRCGENIAWNQTSPADVLRSWMNSAGHKANIMNSGFTEIGMAVAVNARGERYWTQIFGSR
jgi:uncharacterized protein YkwD